ncbi:hypothetical protein L1887_37926 [Cichorium endivia]|nr:hypothetical protein L1887_37926 [Cichorium endivia]
MEGVKLSTALAITMIVLIAFTSSGTVAQEFGAAPAPSPSMENAGMALQVPALLAAIVSLAVCLTRSAVSESRYVVPESRSAVLTNTKVCST